METFQQPKITGYRQLSEEEAALMNEAKALAQQCGDLVERLRRYVPVVDAPHPTGTPGSTLDQRWISIGATQLQQGFMAITRGIAQPTTF